MEITLTLVATCLLIVALEAFLIVQLLRVVIWIAHRLIRLDEIMMQKEGRTMRFYRILRKIFVEPL